MTISDEQLSAYLDGELIASEMERIEQALENSTELAVRFEKLVSNDQLLKEALEPIAQESMPANIADLLKDENQSSAQNSELNQASNDNDFWQRWSLPIAASIALFVGVGIGNYGFSGSDNSVQQLAGIVDDQGPLYDLLENQSSGTTIDLSKTEKAEVILSFANSDGQFCREFSVTSGDNVNRAVACREDGWNVKVVVQSAKSEDGSKYQTASSESDFLFDQFMENEMKDDALNTETEQNLIEREWIR